MATRTPRPHKYLRGPGIHSTRASSSKSPLAGSYKRRTTARLAAGNGSDLGPAVAPTVFAEPSIDACCCCCCREAGAWPVPPQVRASKTCADCTPEMRTTATPAGPALPVARAKIVSSEDVAEVAAGRSESCWMLLFMLEPTARRNPASGGGAPPAGCPRGSVTDEVLNAVARRGCRLPLLPRCPVGHAANTTAVETARHGSSGDTTTRVGVLRSHGIPGRCLVSAINELRRRHTGVGLESGSRIALEVNAVAVAAVVLAVILGTKQCDPSGESNTSKSETERNGESPPTSISVLRRPPTNSNETTKGQQ